MNKLETFYNKVLEIQAQYENATGQEKVEFRKSYYKLMDSIDAEGAGLRQLYRMYERFRECGNAILNIDENYNAQKTDELLKLLREVGITEFTFSSNWSGAIDTVWNLTQNGCEMQGMVLINSPYKSYGAEEYGKIPALVFKVN